MLAYLVDDVDFDFILIRVTVAAEIELLSS